MPTATKVKVTHTLTLDTREALRDLAERGEIKDASSFIEEALEAALKARKMQRLALELQAFEDTEYQGEVARQGDTDLEDVSGELTRRG